MTQPTPYRTLDDVAENVVHKPRRWVLEFLRANPNLTYTRAGRDKLFTAADIEALRAALPRREAPVIIPGEVEPCHSSSSRRARASRRTGRSGELTYEQKSIRLQELMTGGSPSRKKDGSKKKSNVVCFPKSANPTS